jgi:hypothetical protein
MDKEQSMIIMMQTLVNPRSDVTLRLRSETEKDFVRDKKVFFNFDDEEHLRKIWPTGNSGNLSGDLDDYLKALTNIECVKKFIGKILKWNQKNNKDTYPEVCSRKDNLEIHEDK